MPVRRSLFRKYALTFAGLVTVALLVSGTLGLYFSYRDARDLVDELQREKARSAALRIEQFARLLEGQLRGALLVEQAGIVQTAEERHLELIRLLRQAPAIVDVAWVDRDNREQVRASRITRDEIGSGRDWSGHAGLAPARTGSLYVSPVTFRHDSEPFATLGVTAADNSRRPTTREDRAVLFADVNLKLVWEVVADIRIGKTGYAYVVDAAGHLISHPDIGLVLRKTDLSNLKQVKTELAGQPAPGRPASVPTTTISRHAGDGRERWTLTAGAHIPALDWHVLVEQPMTEVFAPLFGAAMRTGIVLLAGIALAALVAMVLARRMSAPIRALQESAARIGAGRLQERVMLATHDELQDLAEQFNRMVDRLKTSYDELESKVASRTRELAAANDAKSRFLAAASHDLRQPAHALGLFVAQLRAARTREDRERLLARIESSSRAVSELLESLFDISKLDAGRVVPRSGVFPIQKIFDRLEHHYAQLAQGRELRFRIRPSTELVQTDPLLLEQILMNLTANAMRYTREGGVLIAARRRAGKLRVEVWDTGIGIAAHDRERIFEEFFQAQGSLDKDQSKGLGLGLAIVRRAAQLLHLRLEVRSSVGRGSVFAVEVPRGAALSEVPKADVSLLAWRNEMSLAQVTALVVDDDLDTRDAVAGLLAQWGCNAIVASSGSEARAALSAARVMPNVIVCDFRLADGELGTEVVGMVRRETGVALPALIVSADEKEAARAIEGVEAAYVLAKPLEAAKLRALLHHVATEARTDTLAGVAPQAQV